jgi:hypothetical protein
MGPGAPDKSIRAGCDHARGLFSAGKVAPCQESENFWQGGSNKRSSATNHISIWIFRKARSVLKYWSAIWAQIEALSLRHPATQAAVTTWCLGTSTIAWDDQT